MDYSSENWSTRRVRRASRWTPTGVSGVSSLMGSEAYEFSQWETTTAILWIIVAVSLYPQIISNPIVRSDEDCRRLKRMSDDDLQV
jgi:hypothetical protein